MANLENENGIRAYVTGVVYAVAGDPIGHSYSPTLFSLVQSNLSAQGLIDVNHESGFIQAKDMEWVEAMKSQNTGLVNFADYTPVFNSSDSLEIIPIEVFSHIKYEVPRKVSTCLNLTSPLKHQLANLETKNLDNSEKNLSVNCLGISDGVVYSISTDGLGVAWVAMQNGIDITKSTLGISGGGGTARSAMKAWIELGGRVKQVGGRRKLLIPEEKNSDDKVDFLLVIDDDFSEIDLSKDCVILHADYSTSIAEINGFKQISGLDLLIAQHLLCWYLMWGASFRDKLPTFSSLKDNLIRIKVLHDDAGGERFE